MASTRSSGQVFEELDFASGWASSPAKGGSGAGTSSASACAPPSGSSPPITPAAAAPRAATGGRGRGKRPAPAAAAEAAARPAPRRREQQQEGPVFPVGCQVMAQVTGWPSWPAVVVQPSTEEQLLVITCARAASRCVLFYGQLEFECVPAASLSLFRPEAVKIARGLHAEALSSAVADAVEDAKNMQLLAASTGAGAGTRAGTLLEVRDKHGEFWAARVVEQTANGALVSYLGWPESYNEWIASGSEFEQRQRPLSAQVQWGGAVPVGEPWLDALEKARAV